MRIGNLYGPDATFLGVPSADPDVPAEWSGAGAAVIGAPFDGGTSHRPGCRFGPQAIRTTDYLPHDGQRPSLALGVDPLVDLAVVDLGDVEMPSGDTELSLRRLEQRVTDVARAGVIPVILGGGHTGGWDIGASLDCIGKKQGGTRLLAQPLGILCRTVMDIVCLE